MRVAGCVGFGIACLLASCQPMGKGGQPPPPSTGVVQPPPPQEGPEVTSEGETSVSVLSRPDHPLAARLRAYVPGSAAPRPAQAELDGELRSQLEALGYLGDRHREH